MVNADCKTTNKAKMRKGLNTILFPISVKSKWPETMFAIKRIPSVPGRITVLINSIRTIKLIKGLGVLKGTKWASILFVWVNHPNKKNPVHIENEIIELKVMWLEEVKMLGKRPIKFVKTNKKNIEMKKGDVPSFLLFKAIENCWVKFLTSVSLKQINRLGITQNL